MARKKIDPLRAREAKQKKFVAVGGVLLVLVFGYEAKSLLLKKTPPADTTAPVAAAAPPTTPTTLAPPTLAGTAPAAATPSGTLADTDIAPTPATGQLVSFGMFESKNPFRPQIKISSGSASSSSSPPPATASPAGPVSVPKDVPSGATVTPSGVPTTPAAGTGAGTTTTPTAPQAAVTISVNGSAERVAASGTFPSGSPVFRLVSFGRATAKIGIVGGSYQSGEPTLDLEQGKPVTLMNTSDGKRYTLVLLRTK